MKELIWLKGAGGVVEPESRAIAQAGLGLRLASLLLAIVSAAHFARFWFGWDVEIDGHHVGLDVSAIAFFLGGALSLWFWKLAVCLALRKSDGDHGTVPPAKPRDAIS